MSFSNCSMSSYPKFPGIFNNHSLLIESPKWHSLSDVHSYWCLPGFTIRGGSRAAATSKMECFVIRVNSFQRLTIIIKHSILDVAAALYSPLTMVEDEECSRLCWKQVTGIELTLLVCNKDYLSGLTLVLLISSTLKLWMMLVLRLVDILLQSFL